MSKSDRRSRPASRHQILFLIALDLTKMQVDTNVSESDIGGITEGKEADIHSGRLSGYAVFRARFVKCGWPL